MIFQRYCILFIPIFPLYFCTGISTYHDVVHHCSASMEVHILYILYLSCKGKLLQDGDAKLCSICFDRACTMEVQDCKHQMCAHCVLALCCHSKPNPTTLCLPSPACPFCRTGISKLVIANAKDGEEQGDVSHRLPRTQNCTEGSSSFRDLSSAMGSFGNIEITTDSRDMVNKL